MHQPIRSSGWLARRVDMFSSFRIAPILNTKFCIFLSPKKQIQSHLEAHLFQNPKSMRKLNTIFRSTKSNRPLRSNSKSPIKRRSKETNNSEVASPSSSPVTTSLSSSSQRRKGRRLRNGDSNQKKKRMRVSAWSVYLIVSSRLPRTYVGVTTNFTRRSVFW